MSDKVRDEIKARIESKLIKIATIERKIARTPIGHITRKVHLSKNLLQAQGALKELHNLALHFYATRNEVQIEHLSQYVNHNCGCFDSVNIDQDQDQDLINLVSEDSDGEADNSDQDQDCIDIISDDSDIKVVENLQN